MYNEIFSRNIGIFSKEEQDKLRQSTIAIAGVGGVGPLLAERLVRMGIGNIKIADPGVFKKSDFNRQFGSSLVSEGNNKATVIYQQLKDINPEARIEFTDRGIWSEKDARLFASNSNLVIDEMDFGLFRQSIWLQRAARQKNIHYLFAYAIGFGAMVVVFGPSGLTLEEYDNLLPDADLNKVDELNIPLEKILPVFPSYGPSQSSEEYKQIIDREKPGPTTSVGVGLTSILAANEAINIILKKREIITAPRYIYLDLMDRRFLVGDTQ